MAHYFAYCTLLDRDEMGKFCPTATPGETGSVSGWRVTFAAHNLGGSNGGCHLIEAADHTIYGLLYELDDTTLAQLDSISGVDQGMYKQIPVQVTTSSGESVSAITYLIPNSQGDFQPSANYVRPILKGAIDCVLPAEYQAEITALVERSVAR